MVFNLLSTTPGRGYKTYLAKTPFKTFELTFGGGARVLVEKDSDQLVGGYTVTITSGDADGTVRTFPLKAAPDQGLKTDQNPFDELHNALSELSVSLYFLPDDRKVKADFVHDLLDAPRARRSLQVANRAYQQYLLRQSVIGGNLDWTTHLLAEASESTESHHLEIAPDWIRSLVRCDNKRLWAPIQEKRTPARYI